MKKEKAKKMIEDSKNMEDEIYELFLENINLEIDRTIKEVMEKKGLTASRVMEDYQFQIKKALFISRNEV